MKNLTAAELEERLPKLHNGNYKITSPATGRYNCMAFANNNDRKWWQHGLNGGKYHWPPNVGDTLDGWIKIFTDQGFASTDNRAVEMGFDKVAIYVDLNEMLPGHVAISDGHVWKSKLGRSVDIEHSSLDLLEGSGDFEYGIVERVLARRQLPRRKRTR